VFPLFLLPAFLPGRSYPLLVSPSFSRSSMATPPDRSSLFLDYPWYQPFSPLFPLVLSWHFFLAQWPPREQSTTRRGSRSSASTSFEPPDVSQFNSLGLTRIVREESPQITWLGRLTTPSLVFFSGVFSPHSFSLHGLVQTRLRRACSALYPLFSSFFFCLTLSFVNDPRDVPDEELREMMAPLLISSLPLL